MARTVLTAVAIVLLNVLVGCNGIDSGRGQIMPARTSTSMGSAPVVKIANASEADYVEQVAVNRQAYRQGLELLLEHYTKRGNNMKVEWAKKELAALDAIPQYNYIIEASVAGPGLKASTSIPEADYLYKDALELERKAGQLIIIKDKSLLRLALDKYNQLIKKHPFSDKIDDAAYRAAGIYEHFRDYTIAALYYQRTYQWDPETIYPARFKRAYILDKRLPRRVEALELYKQALDKEDLSQNSREFVEERITELSQSSSNK